MRLLSLAVAVCLFVPLHGLSAQEPPILEPGSRVRLTAPDCGLDRQTLTLEALRGETLVFDTMECRLGSVMGLDVYTGRKSHFWLGATIGAGVVAATGAYMFREGHCFTTGPGCSANAAIVGAATGALIGGLIGGLVWKTDRWEEVPLDRLRVSFAPQRDGRFALGLRIAF